VWYPFSGSPSPGSVYNAIHRLPPSYKRRNGLCGREELMSLPGQLLPDGRRAPIASRSMNMGDFYPNTPGNSVDIKKPVVTQAFGHVVPCRMYM
jgi:hypothetical protein